MDIHNDSEMKFYYKKRAPIYDRIYSYPERQNDLRFIETYVAEQFIDCDVLEVAAGTGYWSQFIVSQANSLLATDASMETLAQIKMRSLSKRVPTKVVDAYFLDELPGKYNAAFAGLWISHVPRQRLNEFLSSMHKLLSPGAKVLFMDNTLAQCARLPLSHTD